MDFTQSDVRPITGRSANVLKPLFGVDWIHVLGSDRPIRLGDLTQALYIATLFAIGVPGADKNVGLGVVTRNSSPVTASDEHPFLRWILVHPNFQGDGIEALLHDNCVDKARSEGGSKLAQLFTWADGPGSRLFILKRRPSGHSWNTVPDTSGADGEPRMYSLYHPG